MMIRTARDEPARDLAAAIRAAVQVLGQGWLRAWDHAEAQGAGHAWPDPPLPGEEARLRQVLHASLQLTFRALLLTMAEHEGSRVSEIPLRSVGEARSGDSYQACLKKLFRKPALKWGRLFSLDTLRLPVDGLDEDCLARFFHPLRKALSHLGKEDQGKLQRLPGALYEQLLSFTPRTALSGSGAPVFELCAGKGSAGKGSRKSTGAFYTPDAIVQQMVKSTLTPLLPGEDAPAHKILALKVLDPAMGAGHFLVAACDFSAQAYTCALAREGQLKSDTPSPEESRAARRAIAASCLYGLDLDPVAVELAQLSLWFFTLDPDLPDLFLAPNLRTGNALFGALPGYTARLPGRDFLPDLEKIHGFRRALAPHTGHPLPVGKGEALLQQIEEAARPWIEGADRWARDIHGHEEGERIDFFHWPLAFPEVFFNDHDPDIVSCCDSDPGPVEPAKAPGFSAIIGNPPYGDLHSSETKAALERFGYPRTGGRAEIYAQFLHQGLNLLAAGGRLSFILPNTLLQGRQFTRLRKEITDRAQVESIIDFQRIRIFDEAEVYCMILQLCGGRPSDESYHAPYRFPAGETLKERVAETLKERAGAMLIEDEGGIRVHRASPEPWRRRNPRVERLRSNDLVEDLSPGIAVCRDGGLDYKYKAVGWARRGEQPRLGKMLVYEGPRRDPRDKPLIRGSQIRPFRIEPREQYLIHDWKKLRSKERSVIAYPELMEAPIKILTRQTSDRLVAALDRAGRYTAKSVHTVIVTSPHYAPEFLCALLNSAVMTGIYQTLSGEQGRTFAQVRVSDLRCLPIRKMGAYEAGRSHPRWRAHGPALGHHLAQGRIKELESFVTSLLAPGRGQGGSGRLASPEIALIQVVVTELVRFLESLDPLSQPHQAAAEAVLRLLDSIFERLYSTSRDSGCISGIISSRV